MAHSISIQNGKFRNKKIALPPESSTGELNVTPALLKEAAFQHISNLIKGEAGDYAFFDLCSCTGQMGLEALSRGFGRVHLVELERKRFAVIKKSVQTFEGNITLHNKDFKRMAPLILEEPRSLLYLDPPYSFWNKSGNCPALERFLERIIQGFSANSNGASHKVLEIVLLVQSPHPIEPEFIEPFISNNPALSVTFNFCHKYRRNFLTAISLE